MVAMATAVDVVVFGSVNVDLVVTVPRLPRPGETVTDGRFERHHGGKGANQAVAAARAGARVRFVGAVGEDPHGDEVVAALAADGIDTSFVQRTTDAATGTALIVVDADGENAIAVAPGANRRAEVDENALVGATVGVAQMEARADAVVAFLRSAREAGLTTILNAAPFVPAARDAAARADVIVVNEDEQAMLGAVEGATVVTTRGAEGLVVTSPDEDDVDVSGHAVEAVDTVGAGDAVCGTLAAGLALGLPLPRAAVRANAAGALATTRPGARSSPTAAEVDDLLARP